MITLSTRKLFRLVSLVVMVALMFVFIQTMAQGYMSTMQCMTDISAACQNPASDNSQAASYVDGDVSKDEWLCSTGEAAYCSSNQLEVASLPHN